MSEHTELPWAYKSNGHYFDIGVDHKSETLPIYPCAVIGVPHEQEDNARLIVTAVNNHERLVELLAQCSTELAESIEGKYQGILGYPSTDRDYRTDMAIVEEARALLASLEAEKGGGV